jgi:hypothetical protein
MSSSVPSLSSADPVYIRLAEPVSPTELAAGTPILLASYTTGGEFLESFALDRGRAGELAVRTRASPPPGTAMVVELDFPGLPNHVFVRATAVRRWLGGHLVLRLDDDEVAKREYLLAVARGDAPAQCVREHRRFVVRLPLTWRRFGTTVMQDGVAEDLSAGGLLVATAGRAPPVGEQVAVRLRAQAAYQDLVLTGSVRHGHLRAPERCAFGVALTYRSSEQQRTLRSLLRVFAHRGVVLVDPSCDLKS